MITGRVKWFNDSKGYGFIETDEGKEVHIKELKDLDSTTLNQRLYRIQNIYTSPDGNGQLQFQYHLEAREDKVLGTGSTKINFDNPEPRLLLTPGNFTFAIEGIDFIINIDGTIKWI